MHVHQADAAALHPASGDPVDHRLADAEPRVPHRHPDATRQLFHLDGDPTRRAAGLDAVQDGVFHQRLQQQARHLDVHVVHLEHHLQLVAEAGLLDGHVVAHLLQLLLDIDEGIPLVEVVAQVVRQVGDKLARLLGPNADQRRDGVEGVEQEVRVDLALQRGELRLAGHLFQLLDARHLHLGGDELGEAHRHLPQRAGDAVGAAVIDLEGAADGAVLPQRNNDDRVKIGQMVQAQIVVDDDLIEQHRLAGHGADGVVLVQRVVILAHPHISQHVVGVGDGHRIGADLAPDDVTHLAEGVAVDVLEKRQGLVGDIQRQLGLLGGDQLLLVIQILHQLDDEADA